MLFIPRAAVAIEILLLLSGNAGVGVSLTPPKILWHFKSICDSLEVLHPSL